MANDTTVLDPTILDDITGGYGHYPRGCAPAYHHRPHPAPRYRPPCGGYGNGYYAPYYRPYYAYRPWW